MKRILPYFHFLANLILVLVVAWALGFDFPIANGKTKWLYMRLSPCFSMAQKTG